MLLNAIASRAFLFCSLMSRTSDIEVADLWGWHIPTITDIEAGIVKDYHVGG